MRKSFVAILFIFMMGCTNGTPVSPSANSPSGAGWELLGVNEWIHSGNGIQSYTLRLKVRGGYIYRVSTDTNHGSNAESLVFIPGLQNENKPTNGNTDSP